jgi:hypothetical protein
VHFTEVMVNGPDDVYVEWKGRIERLRHHRHAKRSWVRPGWAVAVTDQVGARARGRHATA